MTLLEKLSAAVGLGEVPLNVIEAPIKRRMVKCACCDRLTPADELLEAPAERCPSCSRFALLMAGSSFVFECKKCQASPTDGIVEVGPRPTTFFALDKKRRPFSVYGLRRIHVPEKPGDYAQLDDHARAAIDKELAKFTPAAIEAALQQHRQVLSREQEEKRLSIPRYCLSEACRKYLWEQKGGLMKCAECAGPIVQLAAIWRVCVNPRCEASERDPKSMFIPRNGETCGRCGHALGRKPGTVRPEGIYE